MTKIFSIVNLLRPYNVVSPILAFMIGYFFIATSDITQDFNLGLLVIIITHSLATVQNDLADLRFDRINPVNRPLAEGKISIAETKNIFYLCLCVSLIIGGLGWPTHMIAVLIMLFIAWAYNLKSKRLSHKPILSIATMAMAYFPIPALYGYYLFNHTISLNFLAVCIAYFILRFSISMLKDLKDEKADLKAGRNTFLIKYGANRTIWLSFVLSSISFVLILYLIAPRNYWVLGSLVLLALYSIFERLRLMNNANTRFLFNKIFFGQNRFDLILLAWLILAK